MLRHGFLSILLPGLADGSIARSSWKTASWPWTPNDTMLESSRDRVTCPINLRPQNIPDLAYVGLCGCVCGCVWVCDVDTLIYIFVHLFKKIFVIIIANFYINNY